jgi:hypothetical protein
MFRKTTYTIAVSLILLTPFIYSNELYNGVVSAKQIWFYGVMALLMLVAAIDLLIGRRPLTLQLSVIDLSLLAFYIYYFSCFYDTLHALTAQPEVHKLDALHYTLLHCQENCFNEE